MTVVKGEQVVVVIVERLAIVIVGAHRIVTCSAVGKDPHDDELCKVLLLRGNSKLDGKCIELVFIP